MQDGIPDEGRPGRKGKGKKGRGSAEGVESVLGVGEGEGDGSEAATRNSTERPDSAERVDRASQGEGMSGMTDAPTGGEFKWPPVMPPTTTIGTAPVTVNGYGWEKVPVREERAEAAGYVAQ